MLSFLLCIWAMFAQIDSAKIKAQAKYQRTSTGNIQSIQKDSLKENVIRIGTVVMKYDTTQNIKQELTLSKHPLFTPIISLVSFIIGFILRESFVGYQEKKKIRKAIITEVLINSTRGLDKNNEPDRLYPGIWSTEVYKTNLNKIYYFKQHEMETLIVLYGKMINFKEALLGFRLKIEAKQL